MPFAVRAPNAVYASDDDGSDQAKEDRLEGEACCRLDEDGHDCHQRPACHHVHAHARPPRSFTRFRQHGLGGLHQLRCGALGLGNLDRLWLRRGGGGCPVAQDVGRLIARGWHLASKRLRIHGPHDLEVPDRDEVALHCWVVQGDIKVLVGPVLACYGLGDEAFRIQCFNELVGRNVLGLLGLALGLLVGLGLRASVAGLGPCGGVVRHVDFETDARAARRARAGRRDVRAEHVCFGIDRPFTHRYND
eukprot:5980547-Prymnesium_polylepis.1